MLKNRGRVCNSAWENGVWFISYIAYCYNYVNAPNGGCYWLDNLENGEKITEIPQEPEREDYIFTGWYKELECINAWNFGRDTIFAGEDEYIENALYAQWITT